MNRWKREDEYAETEILETEMPDTREMTDTTQVLEEDYRQDVESSFRGRRPAEK